MGPEVVCLGESMVCLHPAVPAALRDVDTFHRSAAGAESNVACHLARAGHRVDWLSRLGADGFGDFLLDEFTAAGVGVGGVARDELRPTGVYFKELGATPGTVRPRYYRAGSAASAMSRGTIERDAAWSGRVLHLTGITAALSPECADLLFWLTEPSPRRPLVSFDVNYRPALWKEPPDLLAALAARCDLVFVGADEWPPGEGESAPERLRKLLPEPGTLVVKQGAAGATSFRGTEAVHQPAPRVDVVEPIGAGDAFAAGYLSGLLRGLPEATRLRLGHLAAAATLTVPGDVGPAPGNLTALTGLDDAAWSRLHLTADWALAGPR